MHELSLHASLPDSQHGQFLHQLHGITRMRPVPIEEVHIVYRTRTPPGLGKVPSIGGSQTAQLDTQKVSSALGKGIHFVKLVGSIHSTGHEITRLPEEEKQHKTISWTFEFKDTPDAGRQAASTRLVSRTSIEAGEIAAFMTNFGFDYVSRYLVKGHRVYDRETTISVHRLCRLPDTAASSLTIGPEVAQLDISLQDETTQRLVDESGSWLVEASIEVVDGNIQTLKDQAIRQLNAMAHILRGAIDLQVADRLALDTRIVVVPGQ